MNPISTRVLLLLLFFSSLVAALNFTQCLENFRQSFSSIDDGGVNSQGQKVIPAEAVGLTYRTCTAQCGSDWETFDWKDFAQRFSAWLLPWLALLSQLPFGSSDRVDDFVSVIMSLGSPALAAYSLVLTSLNARSAHYRVKASRARHKKSVKEALVAIQQTSLELTKDDRLLEFIQDNHRWREEIGERLSRRGMWSLATATSVAWVVIAFLLTLVDSFVSLDEPVDNTAEGHAVGTVWLWLLCLVVGWMWVPIFDSNEITTALDFANQQALKKASKKLKKTAEVARMFLSRTRGRLANKSAQEVGNQGDPGNAGQEPGQDANPSVDPNGGEGANRVDPVTAEPSAPQDSANPETDRSLTSKSKGNSGDAGPTSDQNANPNPGGRKVADRVDSIPVKSPVLQDQIDPDADELLIPKDLGSLNRDERRLSPTFNYSRTVRYLVLVDDVLKALDKVARREFEKRRSSTGDTATPFVGEEVVFPRRVFRSMFLAAIMALVLQCGTSAAATIIIVFTPPIGLECRSLGYIAYGVLGSLIMFITIISTIFARISETRKKESATLKSFTKFIAIFFRGISFILALINGVGLIALCCFQFSHFLDNCYCNATFLGRGVDSYMVISYDGSVSSMRNSRLAAVLLSGTVMFIYMVFLRFMTDLPNDLKDD